MIAEFQGGSYCIRLFVVDSVVSKVVTHVLFAFLQMKIYSMTIWLLASLERWRQTPLSLMHIGWRAVQVLELLHLFRKLRVYHIFLGYLSLNVIQLTHSHAGIMLREMLQWPRPLPLEDERARLLCEVFVVKELVISQDCFSLSFLCKYVRHGLETILVYLITNLQKLFSQVREWKLN